MRRTTHDCYHCGKRISRDLLIFENYDGFRHPCHRNCWRDAKHEAEAVPTVDSDWISGGIIPIPDIKFQLPSQAPPEPPKPASLLHLKPRSKGWYDVMGSDGKKINPTPVRKKAAEAFVNEANQGKVTP